MPTKEEQIDVLKDTLYDKCRVAWTTAEKGVNALLPIIENLEKIMAIEFAEWISVRYTEGIDRQKSHWFDHRGECVATSTEKLYQLYLNSKEQK